MFKPIFSSYDVDAVSYFNKAGIINPVEKLAVDTFFKSCKANANIWASIKDGLVYLVSPTSYGASLYNAVNTSFNPTAGVAPTYSTGGWAFNGTTQYLDCNFNPLSVMTANTGFILTSCSAHTQGNTSHYGASDGGGTTQWQVVIRNSSAGNTAFNAYNAATAMAVANASAGGTYVWCITASNSRFIRRNKASLGTSAVAVGGSLPNMNMYIGARNLAGAASLFDAITIRTHINGLVGLSTTDADTLVDIVDAYNAAVVSGGR